MRRVPLANLVGVDDERVAVPEADRLAEPLGELLLRGAVLLARVHPSHLRGDERVGEHHDLVGADRELLRLPNFLGTPHIGGSTEEAVLAMGRAAIGGLDDPGREIT